MLTICTTTRSGRAPYGTPAHLAQGLRQCVFEVTPQPRALRLLPGSTGTGKNQDSHHWAGPQGSPCASPRYKRSSMAAGSGRRIIRSSCWHSSCTLGAIKAQQWPHFSSVTRSNGTASRIPRNFPFIAAVATEHLYEAQGIGDPVVKYFPDSLWRHKW